MRNVLTATLATHLIPGSSPLSAKVWRVMRAAVERAESAEEVLEYARKTLIPTEAQRVADLLNGLEEAEERLEALALEDVRCITEFDEAYPQRWIEVLSGKHPAAVFASGNAELLQERCIGIVGSRDVDAAGAKFAQEVAAEAVRLGYAVVSGGAKGVDQIAAEAALAAGGSVVEVVPDSLLKRVHAGVSGPNRCLVSPYHPDAGFSAGNAMGRNKLIYALSSATVVVSSALGTGGTWSGAKEALSQNLCSVFVRSGDGVPAGNEALIQAGAYALGTPNTMKAALDGRQASSLF